MDRLERFADLQEALKVVLESRLARVWTTLPGIVESYDPAANTVVVQPAIKGLQKLPGNKSKLVDMPLLPDVPVYFPRGGGVTQTFPIAKDDECIVIFASRCIDGWWQSGGDQVAPEFRMHDLSDAFALIGPQSAPNVIPNINPNTAQMRTDDGSTFIELDPATGDVNIKAPTTNITGDVNVTGTLNADSDVTVGSISLKSHVHSDPQGGNTGPPQ